MFSLRTAFWQPKTSQNEAPEASKFESKSALILKGTKLKNKQTLPHFSSFFMLKKLRKIVQKRLLKPSSIASRLGRLQKRLFFQFEKFLDRKCSQKASQDRPKNRPGAARKSWQRPSCCFPDKHKNLYPFRTAFSHVFVAILTAKPWLLELNMRRTVRRDCPRACGSAALAVRPENNDTLRRICCILSVVFVIRLLL